MTWERRLRQPRRDGLACAVDDVVSGGRRDVGRVRAVLSAAESERRGATATVRYLLPFGLPPIEQDVHAAAALAHDDSGGRRGPGLAEHRRLRRSSPPRRRSSSSARCIAARRRRLRRGPRVSAGVTAPATRWFLAEGATGPFFDLFILLANPNATPARSRRLPAVRRRDADEDLRGPANGRFTIWVDDEEIPAGSGLRPLTTSPCRRITSTNDVPIVVERTMWWPGPELTATTGPRRTTRPARRAPADAGRWPRARSAGPGRPRPTS